MMASRSVDLTDRLRPKWVIGIERNTHKDVGVVIPCEIKNEEDVFASQIVPQAVAAAEALGTAPHWVLPIAVKAWTKSILIVVEFEALERHAIDANLATLKTVNLHAIELVPAIDGIGKGPRVKATTKKISIKNPPPSTESPDAIASSEV